MPRYASIVHLIVLCFLGVLSNAVFALGLGEITLKSHLNQPLVAEIELLQVRELTLSEILPGLASRKDFDRAGVERSFLLGLMSFQVKLGENGRNIILVTTTKPIREPFVNFLIEVIWPSGRLLREYTLLLDPPVFANDAPRANMPAQKSVTNKSNQSTVSRTQTAKSSGVAAPTAPNVTRKPALSSSYNQPADSQQSAARPKNNKIDRPDPMPAGDDQYRVNQGDNLHSIARQMRDGSSTDINRVMVAIQRENPSAFIDQNINLLKQGVVIRKPSSEAIASIDKRTAIQEVERQSKLWKARLNSRRQNTGALDARVLNATGEDATPDMPVKKDQDGGHLSLVGGDGRKSKSGSGGSASAGGDSALIAEELDKAKISNRDLTEKVASLSQQVDDSKKLIELKSQQFAELKARLAEIEAENAKLKAQLGMPLDPVEPSKAPLSEPTPSPALEEAEQTPAPAISDENGFTPSMSPNETNNAGTGSAVDGPVEAGEAGAVPADESIVAAAQPEDLNFNDADTVAPQPSVEPVTEPTTAPTDFMANSWLQDLLNKPFYWMIIGGGLIVLLAAVLLWRRSYQEQFFEDDEFETESEQDTTNNLTDLDTMSASATQTVVKNSSTTPFNTTPASTAAIASKLKSKVAASPPASRDNTEVLAYETDGLSDPFADTDTTEEASDILGEADIYIAYGRFDQAEDVLIKAIKRDKSNPEFYLKLIEVYAEKNDTAGFNRTVKQLDAQSFSANFSHRITELRSTLNAAAANNNTKEEVLDTLPALMADEKGPLESVSDMDFDDENFGMQSSDSSTSTDALSLLDDLESNIIGTVPESDEAASDSSIMDLDADDNDSLKFALDDSFDTVEPTSIRESNHNDNIISPTLQHDGLGDNDLLANMGSLEDQSYDLDIESLASDLDDDLNQMSADRASVNVDDIVESTADEVIGDEDEVATRLDLARAYMDMGDREGAKDLLDEVVRDGTAKQQQEARSLLKKIS
jgi:pilus assembly protein FimV